MTLFVSTARATGVVVVGQFKLASDNYTVETEIMQLSIDSVSASTGIRRFKNIGWYAAGSVFEEWISTENPSVTPPSGHTLTDIQHYPI